MIKTINMKNQTITNLALALAVGFLATGCTATLQHGKINTTPKADKGPMGVTQRADNMKDRIGWGTFTVFAIPVAPVTVDRVHFSVPFHELVLRLGSC
jgi:hypothetical protein